MEKEKQTRSTKKSRTVEEFVAAIAMMTSNGQHDIQKSALVDEVVSMSIVPGTSKAVSDVLSIEMSNLLDNYFSDVVRAAGEELKLPYHLTSKRWYKNGCKLPQSEAEARENVVVFGNGRTGRAAGVRFVTPADEPDPMLMVSWNKKIDVVNAAIKTRNERLRRSLESSAVAPTIGREYAARLPADAS